MSLTVLQVAYPFATVGPDEVGGAEQVLSAIDRGLARSGYRSLVLAASGSRVEGELVALDVPDGVIDHGMRRQVHARWRAEIDRIAGEEGVDVIHVHGVDFLCYLPAPGPALLATLHLPPAWYPPPAFYLDRPNTWLHCVSPSQRRCCPASSLLLPEIPNGVPVDDLAPRFRKRRFALTMGRICPEKNTHAALEAGRIARFPVIAAGKVFPYEDHERYFRGKVVPRLDRWRRFLGPVGFRRKRRLLSSARCLLIPSLAPETSSLAAMEANASGTPVVAFPTGALAELVQEGRTGFLVRSIAEMAEAIHACAALDPERCRAVARERFSLERMLEGYVATYHLLARRAA